MLSLIFLADQTWSTEPWEIVVAILVIVLTGISLFFLYRNVIHNFKQNRLEKEKTLSEKQKEQTNDMDDVGDVKTSRHPLLVEINEDIKNIKEGDLRLLFAINIDNFRYIVDSYEQKDIDKIIQEYVKRLKKYSDKLSVSGHYEKDLLIYYFKGDIDNDKINQISNDLLDLIKQPLKVGNHELTASIGGMSFPL